MLEVEVLVKALNLPTIIAGDFQNTPEDMDTFGWAARLGLSTLAPRDLGFTCSSGKKRVIDFYLVSRVLVEVCERRGAM